MTRTYVKDQSDGFVNQIRKVAIVGAGGGVGAHITASLLKTGQHTVTAITRPESTSNIVEGVIVRKASYDNHAALVEALRGHDALIITMNVLAPKDSIARLVEAGVEAGVPWILPNEWGSDYTNREVNRDVLFGDEKPEIRNLIESKGAAWIAVACGFWYEYSLAGEMVTFGFDFAKKELTYYDDGNKKLHYSTLAYCGQAVAKLLSLPILPQDSADQRHSLEDYKNSICRVHAFDLNQKDMLASVLRVTGDKESEWTIKHATSESRYNEGKQVLQTTGNRQGNRLMLYARMFYPSLPSMTPEDFSDKELGLIAPKLDDATREGLAQIGR